MIPMISGLGVKTIVVALEKEGCFVWDGYSQPNGFELIAAGFTYFTAPLLAKILAAVTIEPVGEQN